MRSSFDRRRATVLGAFVEGWRRVLRAPAIVLGALALTMAAALPAALVVGGQVEAQLGSSRMSERVLRGWDTDWAGEFQAQASGVGRTLTHEILGFGATLATLEQVLDAKGPDPSLVGFIAAYGALWMWISGGILDRLARGRPVGTAAFFAACGVFFFRFLRVAVLIVPRYAALFLWLHPWLFGTVYGWYIRDLAEEGSAMAFRAALYAVFLVALMLVSILSDFTKVRMVVEDRRSAISSVGAAGRFVRRRAWRVAWLYVLNILAQLILARLWLQVTPGAAASIGVALLASQLYLVFRLWARLAFLASEVVFFQGELAHAQYASQPELVWPDSPAVESVRR
jgi:hypothetical protein